MRPRRIIFALILAAVVAGLAAVYLRFVREAEDRLNPDDLARRASVSSPDWANYDEDIKAQIGAAPVAQWNGQPTKVTREGAVVEVTFRLEGPWSARDFVIPILMRDPLGRERRQRSFELRPPDVVYQFTLGQENAESALPWILLKYPHRELRLALDSEGNWSAE